MGPGALPVWILQSLSTPKEMAEWLDCGALATDWQWQMQVQNVVIAD